jgi:hypothetical protein
MGAVPAMHPELDLTLRFINTYDLLETPPDRLRIEVLARITARTGFTALAARFAPLDGTPAGDDAVARLRALRGRLYPVFLAPDAPSAVEAMNHALDLVPVRPRMRLDEGGEIRLAALPAAAGDPATEMSALVTDALAHALSVGGPARLGTCVGDPCRCVYIDRSRAGRQRFCCELCNDRMAAAAYRTRARA